MAEMRMTIQEARSNFFRPEQIIDVNERQAKDVAFRMANLVKVTSQRSMRPARQRALADLTARELRAYKIELAKYKQGERKAKPVRGFVSSRPGEPPRTHGRRLLRKFFFSAWDNATKTVVVGPSHLSGRGFGEAPHTLNSGGMATVGKRHVRILPRPFIAPAVAKSEPKFAGMWPKK